MSSTAIYIMDNEQRTEKETRPPVIFSYSDVSTCISPGSYTPTKWPDPWPYVELGYAYTPPNVPRLTPNTSDRHAKLPDMEVCDQRGQPSVSVPHNGQEED